MKKGTTEDLRNELSTAGNPAKLMAIFNSLYAEMAKVDMTNGAELTNLYMIMIRLISENKLWIQQYEKRTGQKII